MNVSEPESFEEWVEAVDRDPSATFFHTPPWFEAFCRTFPGMRTVLHRFEFEGGAIAFFPLIETRSRWLPVRRYRAGPAGCYGGWVAAPGLPEGAGHRIADWILDRHPNLLWRLNPLDDSHTIVGARATIDDTTELLDLEPFESEEALRKHYHHMVRKSIAKGERAGLVVREAQSAEDWVHYHALYEAVLERWGDAATTRYPAELFENLRKAPGAGVRLWLLHHEDELIGGNLNFHHNRHCVEWHAVFDDRFFKLGSRNFLVHHVIRDAIARGHRYYDFNPSGGLEGTRKFKQRHGTQSVPARVVERRRFRWARKTPG